MHLLRNTKTRFRGYRNRRVKRTLPELNENKNDLNRFQVIHMDKTPSLLSHQEKSVVKSVTGLITALLKNGNDSLTSDRKFKWMESYKHLLNIKKALDNQAKKPGARVYDFRMFDLVVGNSKPTKARREKPLIPPIIWDAYNLIRALEGKPKAVGESTNIKFLSPRLAAIMPDKVDIRGSLSPSIFSFYEDDKEEQLLPIPKLLKSTGLNEKDRDSVLEMVMEIAGARQVIDDAVKVLSNTEVLGMRGELKQVTEKMIKLFTNMERKFNIKQKNDIRKRGFTFLEANQLKDLHSHSELVKHSNEIDFNINEYGNQSHIEREEALWLRIADIAANGTKLRTKRQLSVLQPTILAPFAFSPVMGLTVLGPVILSPSLFSPLILNPSVLSPYILSPGVGIPFILSPYVFSPYLLSPLVMAPFILTPYVLSPNVINPYALSPLILSPLVLSPDILSPMVLGGAILSPSALSPSVLSKSFLMASVLSPSILS